MERSSSAGSSQSAGSSSRRRRDREQPEVTIINKEQADSSSLGGRTFVHSADFAQRMINLLDTGFKSDCVILIGPEDKRIRIPVHRMILTLGSVMMPVLFTSSELKNTLIFEDVEEEPFRAYLRLLYGDMQTELKDPVAVLKLSLRFKSLEACRFCVIHLSSTADAAVVAEVLDFAHEIQTTLLVTDVNNYVCRNAARLFETPEFLTVPLRCLMPIIGSDELQVENEVKLFKYVLRWGRATAEKNGENPGDKAVLRRYVDGLLDAIRFPLMEISVIIDAVISEGVMDIAELNPVLLTRHDFEKQRLEQQRDEMVPGGYPTNDVPIRTLAEMNRSRFVCHPRRYHDPIVVDIIDSSESDNSPRSILDLYSSSSSNNSDGSVGNFSVRSFGSMVPSTTSSVESAKRASDESDTMGD